MRFRLAARSMTSDDLELLAISSIFLGISHGFANLGDINDNQRLNERKWTRIVSDKIVVH